MDELGMVKALAAEGNGVYIDQSRTSVQIVEQADSLDGLKEFEENPGTDGTDIAQLLSTATFDNTDTQQLRSVGNNLLKSFK